MIVPCARAALLLALSCACRQEEGGAAASPREQEQREPSPVSAPATPSYDHVVLVTLDTLRADHLPSYGYARDTAPFLAHLAAEGVLFENALASVSHTAPSHATMLTGVPPRVHGVRRNGNKLARDFPSLPDLFRARGFASGAFLGAQFLGGIAQGFEHVSQRAPPTPELVDQAIEWARAQGERPYFLWLHLYDPHRWKRPKLPAWARESVVASGPSAGDAFFDYITRLHGLPELEPGARELPWLGADGRGQTHTSRPRADVQQYIDDYDGLIRYADAEVQRLYEALEGDAASRKGLWILTCDHGEGLGSHGYEGHGGRIYNEQLRVALLFHASDRSLAPRRVDELVGHVDLVPTLAELFGFEWRPPNGEFFGRSLVPLLHGSFGGASRGGGSPAGSAAVLGERMFFAEQRRAEDAESGDAGEMVALQDRRNKLIRYPDGHEEFFALPEDPLELHDLGAADERRTALRAALEERLRFYSKLAKGELEEPSPEFLEELQDLGYAR